MQVPKHFKPEPYGYHEELALTIDTLTNLGHGLGRDNGWVVMVPFTLPGERVRVRIYKNMANYSEADLVDVLEPSPHRVAAKCPLFMSCGGCQYQHFDYAGQLEWKRQQVVELLERIAGMDFPVAPTHPSPKPYHYRSKLTPHYPKPVKTAEPASLPIGFLKIGRRNAIVDVPACPIATEAINKALPDARRAVRERSQKLRKGGTLLLRDTLQGVVTDNRAEVSTKVGARVFQFTAGEFFQNNPDILPELVAYVSEQVSGHGLRYLVDAYCGVGMFALSLANQFEAVAGVEISAQAIHWANANASINGISNCEFFIGKSETLFASLTFPGAESAMVIDPPRAGCDLAFIEQLLDFGPSRLVYVACDPATQARDIKLLVQRGYQLQHVQPFDLFPQTRHIECVAVLTREPT